MQIMGSVANPRKHWFERTFRYLGYSTSWSLGLFLFAFYILSAISFLTDAVQTANFNWLWFFVSGAGFLPPLLIGFLYKALVLDKHPGKSRPWLSILFAGLAGAARNVSVGLFSLWADLDHSNLWVFRFSGGFFMGISVYTIWAFSNGARIEYLASLGKLAATQIKLASAREQMPEHLSTINERLQDRTKQALIPQLAAIKDLLGGQANTLEAVDRLRYTITEQIRPMMKEIASEQPKPFKSTDIRKFRRVSAALPAKFSLHDKLMVTWSSVIELIGVSMWLIVLGSPNGILDSLICFAIFFSVLSIYKFLLPKQKLFKKSTAIFLTSLFAVFASSAVVFYIYYFLNYSQLVFWMLAGFAIICGMIGPVLLLQLTVRTEKRNEIESQIKDDLDSIAKENSLFAQKLWVFRRRWLLILHGNVQSSLTAALTRLQNAKAVDGVLVELVKQDLARAEKAVDSSLHDPINLMNGILELQEVWAGICEVKVTISERAKRALVRSDDSSFCVNEILKEAVSNAVRHGDATEAKVSIDRIDDDLLRIEVANNGTPPSKGESTQGIGSDLMDEICLNWSLEGNRKQVLLVAELPVKL
jgi:signal transduction histidine kinase